MVSPRNKKDVTLAGGDLLIEYAGNIGRFSPLVKAGSASGAEAGTAAVIDALKQEITTLQGEISRLQNELAGLKSPEHSNDELASALQHSVDTLQNRFSSMVNPVNDFALREFKLEANVTMDVNRLGQVQYRFVKPGEKVEAQNVSKLTLDVVPIPKQTQAGTWTKKDFTPETDVEEIYGIGEKYRDLLNKNRIYTLGDLLGASTRIRSKFELASLLGVERKKLSAWVSQAELMTVRDIDGNAAYALISLGIDTLRDLSLREPKELAAQFNRFVKANPRVTKAIDETRAKAWITTAAQFAGTTAPAASTPPENKA